MVATSTIHLFEKICSEKESQLLEVCGVVFYVEVHPCSDDKEVYRLVENANFQVFVSSGQLTKMGIDYRNKVPDFKLRFRDSVLWPANLEKIARQERARCCAEQMVKESLFLLNSYYLENLDGSLLFICLEKDKERVFEEIKKVKPDEPLFEGLRYSPLLDFLIGTTYTRVGTPFLQPHPYKTEKEILSLSNWLNDTRAGRMRETENVSFFGHRLKLTRNKGRFLYGIQDGEFQISFTDVCNSNIADITRFMFNRLIAEQVKNLFEAGYNPKTFVAIHVDGYLVGIENYPGSIPDAGFVTLQSLADQFFDEK